MIKIRLQRTGRKNRPSYRIVACEHTSPVKGKFIEKIGFYNPLTKECVFDQERYDHWINNGGQPSDTVASLVAKKGEVKQKTRKRLGKRQKEQLEAKKAEEEAKKAEAEEAAKAPVEEAPVEEAPVEEAPVEKAPVEEAPVEKTK